MYSRFQQVGNMALDPTLILIIVGILTFFIGQLLQIMFCGIHVPTMYVQVSNFFKRVVVQRLFKAVF